MSNSKLPIYVSITSIFINQDILLKALKSILNQTRRPDKIFLYLSEESYILDDGFKDKKITNPDLLKLINDSSIIDLKWVTNTGSYRKLLPLLKEKWKEDCIIITIDDDTVYTNNLIKDLVSDYLKYKCVINYRGFTPKLDHIDDFNYYKHTELEKLSLYNFPTGKSGTLYKPEFFHKTKDLIFNDEVYLDTCAKQDDIWFYIVRLLNNIKCYTLKKDEPNATKKWQLQTFHREGVYLKFNKHNNCNTQAFKNTVKKLKNLGHKFRE